MDNKPSSNRRGEDKSQHLETESVSEVSQETIADVSEVVSEAVTDVSQDSTTQPVAQVASSSNKVKPGSPDQVKPAATATVTSTVASSRKNKK